MEIDFKDTLNKCTTGFPMRAGLVEREPVRIAHWAKIGLYEQIQAKRQGRPAFVLHDGPPFTNGDVHIGTALNKLLKDTILRYKSMRGWRTPYVPGWDCHGLPIEFKVMKEIQAAKKSLDALGVRKACADFSAAFIEKQRQQFLRLGILADWKSEYRTMDPGYEAEILNSFATFVDRGLVYRSKKPVYWSIPCQTALAEAEVEHLEKRSTSIWVGFPVPNPASRGITAAHPLSVVIWTTTPWTLPANLAIAVNPALEYVEVRHGGRSFLVAAALRDSFVQACELTDAVDGWRGLGKTLEGLVTRHPFIERDAPIVLADYVEDKAGTGCVHTAPGHGLEDYHTGVKYGLEVYCPVKDDGTYVDDGRVPARLVGVSVLEVEGKNPGNIAVLELLKESGHLLKVQGLKHSYPHCWRSKSPVVFRALDQWFVGLDRHGLRNAALDAIGKVQWIPAEGENRIRAAVSTRPDWCISRQRAWGVPIPSFYSPSTGESYLDAGVIRHVAQKVAEHGADWWWASSVETLLEGAPVPAAWPKDLRKGLDTLDVWIDSGTSHLAVCAKHPDLHWPADLYLEGSDQHRGWFQSSLWTSVAVKHAAPYKAVVTHGFVVNEKREKISKSDAKPQTADVYVKTYGADIVRLWVASQNFQKDVPVADSIFKNISEEYRMFRNTIYFLLGYTSDFNAATDAAPLAQCERIDRWVLVELAKLVRAVTEASEVYEFHQAKAALANFTSNVLSATYFKILKNRLQVTVPNDPLRRSAQTVMRQVLEVYLKLLAPFLSMTADEAWSHFQTQTEYGATTSIHLEDWPTIPAAWEDEKALDAHAKVERLQVLVSQVNVQLEKMRQAGEISLSLDAAAVVSGDPQDPDFVLLTTCHAELEDMWVLSAVTLVPQKGANLEIKAMKAPGVRCPRSWKYVPALVDAGRFGMVSPRCREVLLAKYQTL